VRFALVDFLFEFGLLYNGATTHPARRRAPGRCLAGEGLLGRKDLTGRFVVQPNRGYFIFNSKTSSASFRKRRSSSACTALSVFSFFSSHCKAWLYASRTRRACPASGRPWRGRTGQRHPRPPAAPPTCRGPQPQPSSHRRGSGPRLACASSSRPSAPVAQLSRQSNGPIRVKPFRVRAGGQQPRQ